MKSLADEKDIDILYKKVNDHDTRLTRIETSSPFLQDMLKRSIESSEALAKTMHEVQISMSGLNTKMQEQMESMEAMKNDFTVANTKLTKDIAKVNDKVESIEEKTKFDILNFIKKNWPWIMLLIGLGINYLSQYAKY